MNQFDTLLHPDFVVPIVPHRQVLSAHSVGIKGGTIASVMPRSEALALEASEHIELAGCALMPGLINLHCHAAMSLLRGYADDLPLMTWLQRYIWPTETRFISPDFVRTGSELAIADLLLGGTTTLADQYFFLKSPLKSANGLACVRYSHFLLSKWRPRGRAMPLNASGTDWPCAISTAITTS